MILKRPSILTLTLLLLAIMALVLTSCSAHDPQNTLASAGIVAKKQEDLFWLIFWWAAGVFVVVELLLLFVVLRFRRQPGQGIPTQTHGNTRMEIAWTIAPALVLVSIGIPTISTIWDLATPPAVAMQVKVVGHQWWWEFQYPEIGIVTANELHIPVGETVNFALESGDVIHSFWVPKLGGKQDAVPSHSNPLWLRADSPGMYYGQCAELCGIQHAQMRFRVIAQPRSEFDDWARAQRTPPAAASGEAARGAQIFATNACIGCHTIEGTPGVGKTGPNLTHFGSRTTLASAILQNTPENLAKWLRNPQAVKEGALMPNLNLSEDQVSGLVAYLQSLK